MKAAFLVPPLIVALALCVSATTNPLLSAKASLAITPRADQLLSRRGFFDFLFGSKDSSSDTGAPVGRAVVNDDEDTKPTNIGPKPTTTAKSKPTATSDDDKPTTTESKPKPTTTKAKDEPSPTPTSKDDDKPKSKPSPSDDKTTDDPKTVEEEVVRTETVSDVEPTTPPSSTDAKANKKGKDNGESSGPNVGVVVAAVAGSVVGLIILVTMVVLLRRRKTRDRFEQDEFFKDPFAPPLASPTATYDPFKNTLNQYHRNG
ncbi:hypothetical protein H4R35_004017 [Dimargaris xerosporica]|nr:hypothetical protein H4R35_004017 [Dimargaris xerosporica]